MRKVIIDTDPGIDDSFAITAASKYSDFEILGITTVAGNKGIDITTANALKMVTLHDIDCMVYMGASESLLQQQVATFSGEGPHGADGLGGVTLDYDSSKLSSKKAVDFILDTVKQYPNEVEIIALGPVTNIALAIQQDRDTMKQVKAIYSMGGGYIAGNINPVCEFNYWFDAAAAKEMYGLGLDVPIHMIGLHVTRPSFFSANDILFMKLVGGELGTLLYDMQMNVLADTGWAHGKMIGNVIHDLLAMIYAIDHTVCPNVIHTSLEVSVQGFTTGQTIIDAIQAKSYGPKNAYVAMSVDARKFKETFMEIVFGSEAKALFKQYVVS